MICAENAAQAAIEGRLPGGVLVSALSRWRRASARPCRSDHAFFSRKGESQFYDAAHPFSLLWDALESRAARSRPYLSETLILAGCPVPGVGDQSLKRTDVRKVGLVNESASGSTCKDRLNQPPGKRVGYRRLRCQLEVSVGLWNGSWTGHRAQPVHRVRCGHSCRAVCSARTPGAGGRVSRNEQVVGSIPTGGSRSEA